MQTLKPPKSNDRKKRLRNPSASIEEPVVIVPVESTVPAKLMKMDDFDEIYQNRRYATKAQGSEFYARRKRSDKIEEIFLQDEHQRDVFATMKMDTGEVDTFYPTNSQGEPKYAANRNRFFRQRGGREIYSKINGKEGYPYDATQKREIYALDENGNEYPAKDASGKFYYASGVSKDGTNSNIAMKMADGSTKYITDEKGEIVPLWDYTLEAPIYGKDEKGNEVYFTDDHGRQHYLKDRNGNEIAAGNLVENELIPYYAMDELKNEFYPKTKEGSEYYILPDRAAKNLNGEFYYAKDSTGNEIYPRDNEGFEYYLPQGYAKKSTGNFYYAKDRFDNEMYHFGANGDQYYILQPENIEQAAKKSNGEPFYAKDKLNNEFYPKHFIKESSDLENP